MTNPLQDIKRANREHCHSLWKVAQAGGLEPLPKKDQLLAGIIMEHEEYHDQFQISDLLHDHKYDTESEVNPFLHVIFHHVVENQLESREPIEAFQFYNAIKKNKISRPETIHCLANILIYLAYDVFKGIAAFDMEEHKSLLKRYKNKKPDKIQSSLVREFGAK